ncbi:PPOX class F420-dependent oxidoreductase [Planotetraspora sp. A-T 1434]|uniref:PPOX class F420-dependent oxidoreductase n=1 Tax=Planotetraspora sp. A-T 1434 TaxID=2979219 RepID=UPI0021C1CBE7|nr:PPOX class F420-dependent oxidoreductase [Planotetraspora sp. A-T 1434]MCT9934017.1 PPOX class F420-dependent oxidoreductase [Planotetraspora sp. A-T 1434]
MAFNTAEETYLASQRRGRLATVAPDGTPQNKPVGFHHNSELGTIDIYGFGMESSAKFRNVKVHPDVSFVVDDVVGEGASGVRFLEIRGRAEATSPAVPPGEQVSGSFIRIHPRRIVSYNIHPDQPGFHARDVALEEAGQ